MKIKTLVSQQVIELPKTGKDEVSDIYKVTATFETRKKVRFVRLKAATTGRLPEWHLGFADEGTAWTFIDEITIE